eukprot:c1936_g1_i1.p1 GENE.c1936_g1_i1~~c1936_g1_i1.p1  ORF type:complete len:315 (-),score=48.02 c1936_g1_i1:622-1566(-)
MRASRLLAALPKRVRIVEVGPRDGLQNEKRIVDTAAKVKLIEMLGESGLQSIEATSFVSKKWVPQMGDAAEVMKLMTRRPNVSYPVLTPNIRGYLDARAAGATEVAIFAAATESFSQKNTATSIAGNLERHKEVTQAAAQDGIRVRGYVSCVLGCPYEGSVQPSSVLRVSEALLNIGCYELSLGDTIGTGNPLSTSRLLEAVVPLAGVDRVAVHFHNTYGTALANIAIALQYGISVIDSSVAGLGGCPYAAGATGNVATEDVVYMLHGMGIETGVDLGKLCQAGEYICGVLGMTSRSNAANALATKRAKSAVNT